MMIEVYNSDKGRKGADYLTRNVIELRIPRKVQPEVNKINKTASAKFEDILEERKEE